ncbi:Pr6Pr family membrane protein [Microbacterium terregens]|uniref:Pr6Pr family membrane protein n=1 Tax=Microbacterium terregens TaxID=69363 RepID=A0ABV5SW74_9MICO
MNVKAWAVARAAAAVLIAVALTVQFIASTRAAVDRGWDVPTTAANFFSLFSVQTNILTMLTLGGAAMWLWWEHRRGAEEPLVVEAALAAVTTYLIWTGIVYNVLLRTPPLPEGTRVIWSNEVVHLVIPLFLLADLLFAPRRRALPWSVLAILPLYPIMWGFYTLARGPFIVDPRNGEPFWYPYTFFNPQAAPGGLLGMGGYFGVGVRFVLIALVLTAIGALVIWWGRRRAEAHRERSARAAPDAPLSR